MILGKDAQTYHIRRILQLFTFLKVLWYHVWGEGRDKSDVKHRHHNTQQSLT